MAVFFKRALVSAMGVLLGSWMLPGIQYVDYQTLVVSVCLLALFSAVLKPLLILFALPFVVLTMGIGLLVINALLYSFVAYLVDGFYVDVAGSGGWKTTPLAAMMHADLIANNRPDPLIEAYSLERFSSGHLILERASYGNR